MGIARKTGDDGRSVIDPEENQQQQLHISFSAVCIRMEHARRVFGLLFIYNIISIDIIDITNVEKDFVSGNLFKKKLQLVQSGRNLLYQCFAQMPCTKSAHLV